jgi:hypothetical protein
MTIVIRGREYQVEKTPPEGPLDEGLPIYVLIGKSGKKWDGRKRQMGKLKCTGSSCSSASGTCRFASGR